MRLVITLELTLPEGGEYAELTPEQLNEDLETTGGDHLHYIIAEGAKVIRVEKLL